MSTKISAIIVADSIGPNKDRLTTMLITFPRFILAELNTHRMLSKNSASSRAIPFNKMVENVKNNPFVPIAWQKEHSGMQGSEYLTSNFEVAHANIAWLKARDKAVEVAENMNHNKITKQLCNRLLEPFMWHTVLITATEWENFFNLRCPQYVGKNKTWRSWKEMIKEAEQDTNLSVQDFEKLRKATLLDKLKANVGMAEIHMMALAEAMYDAMNESIPNQLKAGEWHIPFGDKIVASNRELTKVKIATAMCARTSYTVIGDEKEFTIEQQVALHDRLINQVPLHASPMEHCARCMSDEEYIEHVKGTRSLNTNMTWKDNPSNGWCNNYRGFIQYRYLLENG